MLAAGREHIQNGLILGFSFILSEITQFKPKRTQGACSIQEVIWELFAFLKRIHATVTEKLFSSGTIIL
jgi:hypothetical protein